MEIIVTGTIKEVMIMLKSMYGLLLLSLCFTHVGMDKSYAQSLDDKNVYDFSMEMNNGEEKRIEDYKGKVLLIVNTASRCGFTRQLGSMEELYQQYKDQGLEVLAFPANNFMWQEPGTNEEIKNFCFLNYKTTFLLFAKTSVKGKDINPLYKYLTEETEFKGKISWNFNKFLVDAQGKVVARFPSKIDPLSDQVVGKIEELLGK